MTKLDAAIEGRAVVDATGVQHIASGEEHFTVCGETWVAFDLFWDTRTVIGCRRCIEWADRLEV